MTSGRGRVAVTALFVFALTALLYARVTGHEFISLDDPAYVIENPWVSEGLTRAGAAWAFTEFHASNWHPLTWLSHMLDCELFGVEPAGHHAVSALLHALNAALLFLALRSMTGDSFPSVAVALVFAVHPLRVESVAWIAERKDVLSGLFWMLTLLAYARYVRRPRPASYALVFGALAAGLLAKSMLVTLPLVLLLLDVWPLRRLRTGTAGQVAPGGAPPVSVARAVLEKTPLLGLSALSAVATLLAQRSGGAVSPLDALSLSERAANAVTAYAGYLGKTFWPAGLACFYPHPALLSSGGVVEPGVAVIAAGALLALITAAVLRSSGGRPYLAVGWLWYLGTLVPVIGLVQVGGQAMADRYTYLPLIGIYVAAAWWLRDLAAGWGPRRARVAAAAGALLLALLAGVTWVQIGTWKDSRTLFERAIAVTEDNYLAHNALASEAYERGDLERAGVHYGRALEVAPRYARAHCGLGNVLQARGETERAAEHYERALEIDPGYAEAHNNLGIVLRRIGRIDGAIEHYVEAIRLQPDYARAHYNLANASETRGDLDRAIEHYRHAIRIDPAYARAHNGLGLALLRRGELDRAQAQFEQAARADPAFATAHNNLGNVQMRRGDPDGARRHYERAVEIDPAYATAHANLGGIHESQGRPREAALHYRRALESRRPPLAAARGLARILATSDDPSLRDGAEAVRWAEYCVEATQAADPALLDLLAAAYAEAGDFPSAVRTQTLAIERAAAQDRDPYRRRLELYRSGRPR